MAHVYFHIGAHKTGTSYLQALMHTNRAALAQAGLHYPDTGPNNAHHVLAAPWLPQLDISPRFYRKAGTPDQIWDRLCDRYAKAPGALFLSAENFSRITPHRIDWQALHRRLADFDAITVIYTVRPQVDLAQSVWMQVARNTSVPRLDRFVDGAFEARSAFGVPLDHHTVYQTLRSSFAADQIHVFDYETIRQAPGGVADAFLARMGCALRGADLTQPPPDEANISPDPLSLMIAATLNHRLPPPQATLDIVRTALFADGVRPSSLFSRREHDRLKERYHASNMALAEKLQDQQPGFALVPRDWPDNTLYRDDVTQRMWYRLTTDLHDQIPPPRRTWGDRWAQLRAALPRW